MLMAPAAAQVFAVILTLEVGCVDLKARFLWGPIQEERGVGERSYDQKAAGTGWHVSGVTVGTWHVGGTSEVASLPAVSGEVAGAVTSATGTPHQQCWGQWTQEPAPSLASPRNVGRGAQSLPVFPGELEAQTL